MCISSDNTYVHPVKIMKNGFGSVMESDSSTRKMESILYMVLKSVIYRPSRIIPSQNLDND